MRIQSSWRPALAGFLALALGTVVAVIRVEPYQMVGGELLQNNDFSTGLTGWKTVGGKSVTHQGPVLRLHRDDTAGVARIEQRIVKPAGFSQLRLSADIKSNGITPGDGPEHRARLILSSYDQDGNWLAVPHGVARLEGTHDWQHVERLFTVSPEAVELAVIAVLQRASGTVWINNLSLSRVKKRPVWQVVQATALGLWTLFLAGILLPWILKSKSAPSKAALFVLVTVILLGTLIPANVKERLQAGAISSVSEKSSSSAASETKNNAAIRSRQHSNTTWKNMNNAGHFCLFLLIASALAYIYPENIRHVMLLITLLAGATELMQFFVDGRGPGFSDWLLDIGGAFIGILLTFLPRCHIDKQDRPTLSS